MSQKKEEEKQDPSANRQIFPAFRPLQFLNDPRRSLSGFAMPNQPTNIVRQFMPNVYPYFPKFSRYSMERNQYGIQTRPNDLPSPMQYYLSRGYYPRPTVLPPPLPNTILFSGGSMSGPQLAQNPELRHNVPKEEYSPSNLQRVQEPVPPKNEEQKIPIEEESLDKLTEIKICKKLFKGNSYSCRNVFKSIMVNMHTYLKHNRGHIFDIKQGWLY